MIIVFGEFGGEKLLGKARELADSRGERVVVVCSSSGREQDDFQMLVSFGADEVVTASPSHVGEWPEYFTRFLKEVGSNSNLLMFPSNPISNTIMGSLYATSKDLVSPYLDDAEFLSGAEIEITKQFDRNLGFSIQKEAASQEKKTALISFRMASIPPPVEDSSRYGKIRSLDWKVDPGQKSLFEDNIEDVERVINELGSTSRFYIILGRGADERTRELSKKLANRLHASLEDFSGALEIVYGPAIAVEVYSGRRDLPEFKKELISLNRTRAPISFVADVAVVNTDLETIIERLSE